MQTTKATNSRVEGALTIVAVSIDKLLVEEALQADGVLSTRLRWPQGNKRFAGIGNRVIALIVTEMAMTDGHSTDHANTRYQLQGGCDTLAGVCDESGITRFIKIADGARVAAPKTKHVTIEALVGAAYKHDGIACAAEVMRNLRIV